MKRVLTWSSHNLWVVSAGWIIWLTLLCLNAYPIALMALFGAAGMATTNGSMIYPALALVGAIFASVAIFSGWLVARKLPVLGVAATFLAIPAHFGIGAVAVYLLGWH